MISQSLGLNTVKDNILREQYNLSKIHHKYLVSVHKKLNTTNNIKTTNIINFNKNYNDAVIIFEEIKKEWFWIDNYRDFVNNSNYETHRTNFLNNFTMLECISKLYGYDIWFQNNKEKYKIFDLSSSC